jgi:hypothetical protein
MAGGTLLIAVGAAANTSPSPPPRDWPQYTSQHTRHRTLARRYQRAGAATTYLLPSASGGGALNYILWRMLRIARRRIMVLVGTASETAGAIQRDTAAPGGVESGRWGARGTMANRTQVVNGGGRRTLGTFWNVTTTTFFREPSGARIMVRYGGRWFSANQQHLPDGQGIKCLVVGGIGLRRAGAVPPRARHGGYLRRRPGQCRVVPDEFEF